MKAKESLSKNHFVTGKLGPCGVLSVFASLRCLALPELTIDLMPIAPKSLIFLRRYEVTDFPCSFLKMEA